MKFNNCFLYCSLLGECEFHETLVSCIISVVYIYYYNSYVSFLLTVHAFIIPMRVYFQRGCMHDL